jgi:hypothetical protein
VERNTEHVEVDPSVLRKGVKEMKVFQVVYFVKGFQRVSIVAAENKEQAEKMISKNFDSEDDYEFNGLKECELTVENIIHTEVIEVV